MTMLPHQLGFDALLNEADQDNAARRFQKETAHLPSDLRAAIAFHRKEIERHHAAMLALDFDTAVAIRKQAHLLAQKLNHGDPGIVADENAPGCVLERETAAPQGTFPLWSQAGQFDIEVAGTNARIEISGMFGIGAVHMPFAGFSARAVHMDRPFISATGYRSFLGVSVPPEQGMTPQGFVRRVLERYVERDLRGGLLTVQPL